MSSTISYANIAANGNESPSDVKAGLANEVSPESTKSPVNSEGESTVNGEQKVETEGVNSAPTSTTTTTTSDAPNDQDSSSSGKANVLKEKPVNVKETKLKKLAPAPVPKNVWGAPQMDSTTTTTTTTSNQNTSSNSISIGAVDEYKWPTPNEEKPKASNNQKFIKPITNKWVPINAKLILPTNNANNKPSANKKNQRKNKKNKSKGKKKDTPASGSGYNQNGSAGSNGPNGPNGSAKSNSNVEKDVKSDSEVADSTSGTASPKPSDKSTSNPQASGESSPSVNSKEFSSPKNNKPYNNQQYGKNNNPNAHAYNKSGNRSNDVTSNQGFVPVNGYYQPQPYPMNYYNNQRQFRPNQYRGFGRNDYYNNYLAQNYPPQMPPVLPQQLPTPLNQSPILQPIPPPISPKQDPTTALTQQIDYYFSLDNLIKDIFLRKNMSSEGWVKLDLILNFKRVKIILNNIRNHIESDDLNHVILSSLDNCHNLSIKQNDNLSDIELRVKDNYQQWLLD